MKKGHQRREVGITVDDPGRGRSASLNDDCEADQEAFSEPKIEADDFSFSPLGKLVLSNRPSLGGIA
ncbi:MAG: hypothetical protein NTV52_26555 [Acidobacteria bacterium]|nr:hypothetical protein [Acidobacteriota bacterium]